MPLKFTLVAVAVFALVAAAVAHDKMTSPATRAGTEVTGTICDAAAPAIGSISNTATAGDSITVQWDGNHGGPWTVTWASFENTDDLAAYDANDVITVQNGVSTTFTWPYDLPAGAYTLRWTWSNYRSCSDFNVAARALPAGAPAGAAYLADGTVVDAQGNTLAFDDNGNCLNCPTSPPEVGFSGLSTSATSSTVYIIVGSLGGLCCCALVMASFFGVAFLLGRSTSQSRPDPYASQMSYASAEMGTANPAYPASPGSTYGGGAPAMAAKPARPVEFAHPGSPAVAARPDSRPPPYSMQAAPYSGSHNRM